MKLWHQNHVFIYSTRIVIISSHSPDTHCTHLLIRLFRAAAISPWSIIVTTHYYWSRMRASNAFNFDIMMMCLSVGFFAHFAASFFLHGKTKLGERRSERTEHEFFSSENLFMAHIFYIHPHSPRHDSAPSRSSIFFPRSVFSFHFSFIFCLRTFRFFICLPARLELE